MKNLNTNESTSFESSLGSPTKPLQSYEVKKPKQLFFVNSIEDTSQPLLNTIINLGPPPKINPPVKKVLKNKIKYESELKSIKKKIVTKKRHILDFDALFKSIFLVKNKIGKKGNKITNKSGIKSKNKYVGNKRIRNLPNKTNNNKGKIYIKFLIKYIR